MQAAGFRCTACIYIIILLVWTIALLFYFAYVHMSLVFTQTDTSACSSANTITIGDVPFYHYPLSPMKASKSELYCSFDYYVWATDYLLALVPVYVLSMTLFAVVWQTSSAFAVGILAVLLALIEFAKAIYWTLYWTNVLPCDRYQFCVNRDPAQPPDSANTQFIVATILAYVFGIFSLSLTGLERSVKRAKMYRLMAEKKLEDGASAKSLSSVVGTTSKLNTGARSNSAPPRKRSTQARRKNAAQTKTDTSDIPGLSLLSSVSGESRFRV